MWALTSAVHGNNHFNPQRPCGRWQRKICDRNLVKFISIHSARVGADQFKERIPAMILTFQSTAPVWALTNSFSSSLSGRGFQSTAPVWALTRVSLAPFLYSVVFQSTAPVWALTQGRLNGAPVSIDFNPQRPCGRWQQNHIDLHWYYIIVLSNLSIFIWAFTSSETSAIKFDIISRKF